MAFESAELAAFCNNGGRMRESLGADVANRVQNLLFFLDAASHLDSLPPTPPILCKQVSDGDPPQFCVGRVGRGQILFGAASATAASGLDKIEDIIILDIGGSV